MKGLESIDSVLRRLGLTPQSVGQLTAGGLVNPTPARTRGMVVKRGHDRVKFPAGTWRGRGVRERAVLRVALRGEPFAPASVRGITKAAAENCCHHLARRGRLERLQRGRGNRWGSRVQPSYRITDLGRDYAQKLSLTAGR